MPFDKCHHHYNLLLIRVSKHLFPEEKDITKASQRSANFFGVPFSFISSDQTNHLPTPEETGPYGTCPECGEKKLAVYGLCPTCKDAEGGKYNTKFVCQNCKYEARSSKRIVQVLREWGIDFTLQSKGELGIKTITDEGKK